jgi:23S rRNA (guanosine2251-2'-O)-methyltransferase
MNSKPPAKGPWPKGLGKPAHRRFHNKPPKPAPGTRDDGNHVLYGIHTVAEALKNSERRFIKLVGTENGLTRLREEIGDLPTTPEVTGIDLMSRQLPKDAVHQGVLLIAEPLPAMELAAAPQDGVLLALDQVTDPHNVGAILRSAAVLGAAGLIMTARHSPPLDGTLAKSASGALEHVPVMLVQNLVRTLVALADTGVIRIGLDGEAAVLIEDLPLTGAVALVLGAEGKGLRQLTRETCDVLCRIATPGPIASLNVSNAAAVALHLASIKRRKTDTGAS